MDLPRGGVAGPPAGFERHPRWRHGVKRPAFCVLRAGQACPRGRQEHRTGKVVACLIYTSPSPRD
eukprot:983482-Alexandrium_andersonii.AAC.1